MTRKQRIEQNAISEICTLSLGGYEQKVLIEGKSEDLPVIVTLHGGPGSPIPFSVGCRGLFPEFTQKGIMVYWDQLGCGINDHNIDENFRIEHYVRMTLDLIHAMKERFPANKIYVLGMSWGSILALNAAVRMKGEIDAVLVWGQITRAPFVSKEVLATLEQTKMPEKKRKMLRDLYDKPFTPDAVKFIADCVRKYTDGYTNKSGEKAALLPIIWGLLTSPDYKFKDFVAMMNNGSTRNRSIWLDILAADMTEMLACVPVPYHILQGDTDIVTDTQAVMDLIHKAENPLLTCRVIPHTGHIPGSEAMKELMTEYESIIQRSGVVPGGAE